MPSCPPAGRRTGSDYQPTVDQHVIDAADVGNVLPRLATDQQDIGALFDLDRATVAVSFMTLD